ncbi:hypothetical protein BUALT_Bualt01G0018600 [Buddleja alternifolia]|uniref:SET domain-containing protein n=1 Tax=Buddleja alternifolia TaxID=168488 RepID=A0AAV6YAQ8_9LAMI|nr:hypothetical protein BUALT_Bualt01G0018600 [Buddleja alternifolia]
MEMRAIEDIAIGQDLTPHLPPLAVALHDYALTSHCAACFSTLPPPPPPFSPFTPTSPQNPRHVPTLLYCSPRCSFSDSSSAEPHLLSLFLQSPPSTWHDSSDLRLALRLLYIFQSTEGFHRNDAVLERIAGLMTNRERLIFGENNEDQFHVLERIREGAKMIAKAKKTCDVIVEFEQDFELEEMVLCLVLTNAVEVQDKSGCSIGIGVYDTTFSWINHSCSPNACYRFLFGPECDEQPSLKINSAAKTSVSGNGSGMNMMMEDDLHFPVLGRNCYGPRVVARTIKDVKKGEEVTIAYTDLLQPKAHSSVNPYSQDMIDQDSYKDNKLEKLMESFDDAITDYLSSGDPKSCCEKLENLLIHGHLSNEAKAHQKLKLHPFHHLSLNAYTTLASAYKVQASDLLALNHDIERYKHEAFNMFKTSVAYSLLLAGAAHHLFMFESALVASVANFWINAGESLLSLAKDSFVKVDPTRLELSSFLNHQCNYCGLGDTFEANLVGFDRNLKLDETKSRLFNCIANITSKIWSILASGSRFLGLIQDPINFSWLGSPESHCAKYVVKKGSLLLEDEDYGDEVKSNLVLLSEHCLRYGAILLSICYGFSVGIRGGH